MAGDGNLYLGYVYTNQSTSGSACLGKSFSNATHTRLLRVDSSGNSLKINLGDSSDSGSSIGVITNGHEDFFDSRSISGLSIDVSGIVTNADSGVELMWAGIAEAYCALSTSQGQSGCVPATSQSGLMTVSSNGAVSRTNTTQYYNLALALQGADGTYYGPTDTASLTAFDASGNIKWSVPGYYAAMLTDDGSVVAQSADGLTTATFDANGNATGQITNLPQVLSWVENGYNLGSIEEIFSLVPKLAASFAALQQGNASANGTPIQQVQTNQPQGLAKQLPSLIPPVSCLPTPGSGVVIPTCGNVNAIELLTNQSPDTIFKQYILTFAPAANTSPPPNSIMFFVNPLNPAASINVTGPGQVLQITLRGLNGKVQNPFSVETERVDLANRVLSVVTLQGHPLAGWRYWRVYSIGTTSDGKNDVVIETGAYDEPGPGPKNYAGYYKARGDVADGWAQYLRFIQQALNAPQGSNLHNTLGGTQIIQYFPNQWEPPTLVDGYWDYAGFLTNYILNNVCQSTSCN